MKQDPLPYGRGDIKARSRGPGAARRHSAFKRSLTDLVGSYRYFYHELSTTGGEFDEESGLLIVLVNVPPAASKTTRYWT